MEAEIPPYTCENCKRVVPALWTHACGETHDFASVDECRAYLESWADAGREKGE